MSLTPMAVDNRPRRPPLACTITSMTGPPAVLLRSDRPFTAADARACGMDHNALARLVQRGKIHRVDRGAYVSAATWRDATPEHRHVLRATAVLDRYGVVGLSHTSAVVAHGLPTYGLDLGVVHLTRTTRGRVGRVAHSPPVQVHPPLTAETRTTVGGLPVCTVPVAALQVADWYGLEAGLVAAEAALHARLCTTAELRAARDLVRLGRGRAAADRVAQLAGPLSESPGETRTRLLLHTLNIGPVQQQVAFTLPDGRHARVDFLLPDLRVVVEFDGSVKYEGADGRGALVREKRREDGIRATGHGVVRLQWSDLDRPDHVHGLLLAAAPRR